MNSEIFFDFDYHTSFNELGIDIEASMSTGGSNATYIYGSETIRLRETDFEGFEYLDGSYDFSSKAKLILEEDEMTLVKNQNGDIHLIDWVDSLRNYEDGIDGVKLQYRQVSDGTTTGSPLQKTIPQNTDPYSEIFFDFDYHTSFNELGIDIEASMSTGGSNATYIYGSKTIRLRETDFEGFEYLDGSYDFSSKAKLILEEDEMTLVKNQNGDIYLIDWVDSLRNYEDGTDGVKLRYRNVHTQQLPKPEPAPEPEPTPEPDPTPEPEPTPTPEPTPEIPTGPAPNLLSATIRGDHLTLQFDDVLSDTLPRLNNFTLKNGNRELNFKDAEVTASAGQVVLTSNTPVDPTATVTLDYFDLASDQTTGVIQSKSGVDLASFSGFQLNNQTTQDNNLIIDDADFEGNTINLYLNAPIGSAVPSAKRFKVKAGRKSQKIVDIETDPSEGVITLTTKKPVGSYESIKVSYRDLAGDQTKAVLEDESGNDMSTISDYEIINGGYEETSPKLDSAELDDNILTMEFDSIISNTKLSKNRFKVKANGKKLKVESASVEDNDESFVSLVVQTKRNQVIDLQSEITLSYSDPKGDQSKNVIEDIFGNDLLSVKSFFVDIV